MELQNDDDFQVSHFSLQDALDMGSPISCCKDSSPENVEVGTGAHSEEVQAENVETRVADKVQAEEAFSQNEVVDKSAQTNAMDVVEDEMVDQIEVEEVHEIQMLLEDEALFGPHAYTLASQEADLDQANSGVYEFNCATTKAQAWDSRSTSIHCLDPVYRKYEKLKLRQLTPTERVHFTLRKWKGEHY